MSKLLLPILIICLAMWLLLGSFWLGNNTESKPSEINKQHVFVIENEAFKAEAPTIFAFSPSEVDVIINDEQLAVLDSLAMYLDQTPEKQLLLSGYFEATERYFGTHKNIGAARADAVKNILVRKGAPETQVKIQGKSVESLDLNENGLISGGIEFDIFDRENITAPDKKLQDHKINFFFEPDDYRINKYPGLEKEVATLKQQLTDYPNSKLRITAFYNDKTHKKQSAQKRADVVSRFFLEKGIHPSRISPHSLEFDPASSGQDEASFQTDLSKVEAFVF